jgi:hypothetical protein
MEGWAALGRFAKPHPLLPTFPCRQAPSLWMAAKVDSVAGGQSQCYT